MDTDGLWDLKQLSTEIKGKPFHADLVKTVAVIEMFKTGAGLAPVLDVLCSCFPKIDESEVAASLRDLALWSIVIYRKHLSAWGIYAGSDFDIDSAVAKARAEASPQDVYALTKSIELPPFSPSGFTSNLGRCIF